ncbi:MAG: hypothetical protein IK080_03575 [Clostridia bacterium]|nr:hypothetical protein [Clostridia bacterium]
MDINTEGLQELIMAFMSLIANFNIKEIDLDMNAQLLTLFAPIWNPIWVWVTDFLRSYFGL